MTQQQAIKLLIKAALNWSNGASKESVEQIRKAVETVSKKPENPPML